MSRIMFKCRRLTVQDDGLSELDLDRAHVLPQRTAAARPARQNKPAAAAPQRPRGARTRGVRWPRIREEDVEEGEVDADVDDEDAEAIAEGEGELEEWEEEARGKRGVRTGSSSWRALLKKFKSATPNGASTSGKSRGAANGRRRSE
jgi:hypothetical protein